MLQDSNSNQYLTVGVLCATKIFGFKSSPSFVDLQNNWFPTSKKQDRTLKSKHFIYTLNFPQPPLFLSPPFLIRTSSTKKTHRPPQQTHLVGSSSSSSPGPGTVGQVPKKTKATLPGALCLHLGTALPRRWESFLSLVRCFFFPRTILGKDMRKSSKLDGFEFPYKIGGVNHKK